jgi:hypothetical protein
MELTILPSYKIDKIKWDECLYGSAIPFMYPSSSYLDNVADNWSGIIGNDYELIMPIPWRKKFGIKYTYSVPFVQQLGLFGKPLNDNTVKDCMKLMQKNFKYGDYSFNHLNKISDAKTSNNYVLSLVSDYTTTSVFYSDKLKLDLKKACRQGFEYSEAPAEDAIKYFNELYGTRIPNVTASDYESLYAFCLLKQTEGDLVVRKISLAKNTLAINLLIKDAGRLYNLLSCTFQEGRNIYAGHFLYDSLIKEFSRTGLVFDFEGSDIPGVAHFYKSFGAINQPYPKIHFNKLPYALRLFKR